MTRLRKDRNREERTSPDLTPMIDVTFQLLIFFILCTRFVSFEDNFQLSLPKDEGFGPPSVPNEKLTVFCVWDRTAGAGSYVVGIDARARKPVMQSYAQLDELVILPSDDFEAEVRKRARYQLVFDHLVEAMETSIAHSGAQVLKAEISFAYDPVLGGKSSSVPWMFVSLAIDATTRLNEQRAQDGQPPLGVTFKFTDALEVHGG